MKLVLVLFAWLLVIQSALTFYHIPSRNSSAFISSYEAVPASARSKRYAYGFVNRIRPWPFRLRHHVIPFCFVTDEARDALKCLFRDGWKIWSDALGGKPSRETGYNLGIFEWDVNCFTTYDKDRLDGDWNPAVPHEVVAIHLIPYDGHNGATPGYVDATVNNSPNRHRMMLPANAPEEELFAHEIGHVLGLQHEQSRPDRDTYVEFRPQLVQGYHEAYLKAQQAGVPEADIPRLAAEHVDFCSDFGFDTNSVKTPPEWNWEASAQFDYDSIMLYTSSAYAQNLDAAQHDLAYCPLVKVSRDAHGVLSYGRILPNTVPSALDLEFVRKFYPWREPGS